MKFMIEAACGCNKGKIRSNNEDNFYFAGKTLEEQNDGLRNPVSMEEPLKNGVCLAVFDGMGGENFGETASYTAAKTMQESEKTFSDFFISERYYLERLANRLNEAVVEAQKKLMTNRMGSTMVSLYFSDRMVYVCNLGDSRAYRLRDGEFMQISEDHVESRPRAKGGKAPLTQHLGIDPEEMRIEPYIRKGDLQEGDRYLLCSDGLTDMLSNFEISDIMLNNEDCIDCTEKLIDSALEHGGRDNITAIVCRISGGI